jgi:predicted transcriptional regulator
MNRPAGHRRFLSLARRVGVSDARLATILGTTASTVSRLRHGQIQKMDRYIALLEDRVAKPEPFDEILSDLSQWSSESAELRQMLMALHSIVLESP